MKLYVSDSEDIQAWRVPEPLLEPPEYDEPIEVDDIEGEAEFDFEISVAVDESGGIDEYDQTNDWGKNPNDSKGEWDTWDRPFVTFADADKICEDFFEVLFNIYSDSIPKEAGDYTMKGEASLKYIISGIQFDSDEEYHTEYMEIGLDMKQSSISNLEFIPI